MRPNNVRKSDWVKYNTLFFMEHMLGHSLYEKLLSGVERRLYKKIDYYAQRLEPSPFEVREFQPGEYTDPVLDPYNPIIFRGAAKEWACTKKWDFDFFAEKFGDKEVVITNNVGLVGNNQNKFETITLRDYIRELKSGSMKYLKFSQMIHESSDLQEDFNGDWLRKFQRKTEFKKLFFLFMGGKSTMTPIHTALPPTVFVQIYGTKKWVFYPTRDRLFLGVRPDRRTYYFTHADPYNLSDPKFPLLKYANKREIELHPGDVLWFPPLVWHQVENVTDSIGVAYKFFHLPSSFVSSKMLTSLFFLATKPFIIKSALMSKLSKKEYIFNNEQN